MKTNKSFKLILLILAFLVLAIFIIPMNKVEASSKKSITKVTVSSISKQIYTGKSIRPSVTVKYQGAKLYKNKDYKITYSKNKNPGVAKVTIKGIGKYEGTKTKTFKIVVSKVSGLAKKANSKSTITLKWTKPRRSITGYEIYMSTSKKGKYTKIKTVTNKKTTSYKKSSLKANKTYYFKIRAYKIINKKKYYSSFSSIVTIKTKKATKETKITSKNIQSKIGNHLKWFSAAYMGACYGWDSVYKYKDVTGKVKIPGVQNMMIYELVGAKSFAGMKSTLAKYVSKSKFSKFNVDDGINGWGFLKELREYKGKVYWCNGGIGGGPSINTKKAKVISSENGISKIKMNVDYYTGDICAQITLTVKYKDGKYLITDWKVKGMLW